ncbi:MAG: ABC transporter substrate-binding protein [Chloroflexi bacterium]|nr:ABC transporter substrate-binding protein [Chloroflexota bacterium]
MRTKGAIVIILAAILLSLNMGCTAPAGAPATPAPGAAKPAPAAASPAPSVKLETIKLMLPSRSAVYVHHFLGKEKGVYKGEGIDLEMIVMKAPLGLPAILAGEVDYVSFNQTFFNAGLIGAPVRNLIFEKKASIWHLVGGKGVETPAQLKGKTIGITSLGALAHYSVKLAVKYLGLDPDKDVTFVAMDLPEQIAALKAGSIGAAAPVSPFHGIAKDLGFKELIFTGDVPGIPVSTDGLSTSVKKVTENPQQVKRVMRAHLKGLAYVRDHREEALATLQKEFDLDAKQAQVAYDELVNLVYNYSGGVTEEQLQALVKVGRDLGTLIGEPKVPPSQVADQTLIKEVQKELGLK